MLYARNSDVIYKSLAITAPEGSAPEVDFIRIERSALRVSYDAHYAPMWEVSIRGAAVPLENGKTFMEVGENLGRKLHLEEGNYRPWPLSKGPKDKLIKDLASAIADAKEEMDQILNGRDPVELGFEAVEEEEAEEE